MKNFSDCKNRDTFYFIKEDQVFEKFPNCGTGFFADEPGEVTEEAKKSFGTIHNLQIQVCFGNQPLYYSNHQRYFVPGNKNQYTVEPEHDLDFDKHIHFFLDKNDAIKHWNNIINKINEHLNSYNFELD